MISFFAIVGYLVRLCGFTLLMMALFVVVAIVMHKFFSKKGWLNITKKAPLWFKKVSKVFLVVGALVLGAVTGVRIGLASGAMQIVDNLGSEILNIVFGRAVVLIEIPDMNKEIDMQQAALLVDKIKSMQPCESSEWKCSILNGAFEKLRDPFVAAAENFLSKHAADGKIVPADLVKNTWGDVYSDLESLHRRYITSKIVMGFVWLLLIGAVPVLLAKGVRIVI